MNEEGNNIESLDDKLKKFNISSLEHTFEKFDQRFEKTAERENAINILKTLSLGESTKKFIMLYGRTGSGKTHLIEATIIAWAKRGIFTRYYTFSEIARSLKNALRLSGEKYDILFNTYAEMQRLIIDDFGMGTTESKFEISDLEEMIDQRYRKRYYLDTNLITIVATNKDIKEMPDRILSRFCDPEFGITLSMGNKDYRMRQIHEKPTNPRQ